MGRRKKNTKKPGEQSQSYCTQWNNTDEQEGSSSLPQSTLVEHSKLQQPQSLVNHQENACNILEPLLLQHKETCLEKTAYDFSHKSEIQEVLPTPSNVCNLFCNTISDKNNAEEIIPFHEQHNEDINSVCNLIKEGKTHCSHEGNAEIKRSSDNIYNNDQNATDDISWSLNNNSENATYDIHCTKEAKLQSMDESRAENIFVTKNKKANKQKSRKSGKEEVSHCNISNALENIKGNPDISNEYEKIHADCDSNSFQENEDGLELSKAKQGKKQRNVIKEKNTQEPKIQKNLSKMQRTSNEEQSKYKANATQMNTVITNIVECTSTNSEPTANILKHLETFKLVLQDKTENQEPPISSICSSLSPEQITNITKTAVNLNQSLGENEKSKISFASELMQSLLSPAPKDIATKEDEFEYKVIQREIFLNYACHVCKAVNCNSCILKRCNNCKMISYCSKEHQREHWLIHKDLCKAISTVSKAEGMTHLYQKANGLSPGEYRHYRIRYINICANLLGRELELWEKEMFFFAQVCHTCYEFQANKLKMCETCNSVSYCQPAHLKEDHEAWCDDLLIYKNLITYQFHNGMIQPQLPQIIQKNCISLKGNMKSFLLDTYIGIDKTFDLDTLKYVALTELATCPLTALFALQQTNFPLEKTSSLIIHVVGAELHFEGNVLDKWEAFMLHLLPNGITLHIAFIGPELLLGNAFLQSVNKNMCCSECTKVGRKLTFSFWPGYYHDYVHCNKYQKPSLITAFNDGLYRSTGFEDKDSWLPSLEVMLHDATITIVVTEYTSKEVPLDIKRLESIHPLKIIVPPSKNPFSSAKPSLNFLSDETIPVIFKNYYIAVLHRKCN